MKFFNWLLGRNNETKKVISSVDEKVIDSAYNRRVKDIDSLRQYDRGEKEIYAPNLKNTLQGVR
ncbi:MAG TPA: hypothetical protein VJB70_00765 [Candidatus Paceibacterota bacterium]